MGDHWRLAVPQHKGMGIDEWAETDEVPTGFDVVDLTAAEIDRTIIVLRDLANLFGTPWVGFDEQGWIDAEHAHDARKLADLYLEEALEGPERQGLLKLVGALDMAAGRGVTMIFDLDEAPDLPRIRPVKPPKGNRRILVIKPADVDDAIDGIGHLWMLLHDMLPDYDMVVIRTEPNDPDDAETAYANARADYLADMINNYGTYAEVTGPRAD